VCRHGRNGTAALRRDDWPGVTVPARRSGRFALLSGLRNEHWRSGCNSFEIRGVDTERRGVCHALYLAICTRIRDGHPTDEPPPCFRHVESVDGDRPGRSHI
jgi:hypothetical protein